MRRALCQHGIATPTTLAEEEQDDAGGAYRVGWSKAIEITFTQKPVTTWGGLMLFVSFAERIGLTAKLTEVLLFVVTSPNATPRALRLLAFFAGVLADARRLAQLALLRVYEPVRPDGYTLDLESSVVPPHGEQPEEHSWGP